MERYPAIYKTTLVIINHLELCGMAQVPKTLQSWLRLFSKPSTSQSFGLMDKNMCIIYQHFSLNRCSRTHYIACSLWKYHQLKVTKAVTKNALESLSLWQQRVVYWLDSPLLLWTVTLEKPSFLICSSGERATDSRPLGNGGRVGVKRE